MNNPTPFLPATRREFLRSAGRGIGLLAFSRFAPSFLVQSTRAAVPAPEADRTILVLVQLAGGNDGLNTLVPFEDPHYYRLRPTLALPRNKVLPIAGGQALHPACGALQRLTQEGKLAIVQNVGYPNPNRSHFRSTEIWETASSSSEFLPTGWIGRYLDHACAGCPANDHDPVAVHVDTPNGTPETFFGEQEHSIFGMGPEGLGHGGDRAQTRQLLEAAGGAPAGTERGFLEQTLMDSLVTETKIQRMLGTYRPMAEYPGSPFARSLRNVAALVASRLPTRVYFVTLSGFDTHHHQASVHGRLLGTLSAGLAAFQRDLEAHGLDGQVVTMTFSEFGRRPFENDSQGTDHGTAAPLFVMGSRIRSGLLGTPPSLDLPRNQDVTFGTDFRSLYATMLEDWLGSKAEPVLGGAFPKLPVIA